MLPRFFQLGKREAKAIAAEIRPDEAPPRREVVTTVAVPVAAPAPALAQASAAGSLSLGVVRPDEPTRANAPEPILPPQARATEPVTVEPLAADLNRIHVTVSRAFLKKLDAARAALSHAHPGASAQEILEAGLDLLLERHAKRKGLVKTPRREPPPSGPDRVPVHVRRAVWERDGGRCQWPLASGGVCGSTVRCELDHVVPRARGGPSTVENCRLLCEAHNDLSARLAFGDAWMDRFTRGLRAPTPAAPPG